MLEILPELIQSDAMRVLDLGSGVGRNTIPIAGYLKAFNGSVVAVDMLSSAIEGLMNYSRIHQVDSNIEAVQSDIESYRIEAESFDAIIAVSALEHLRSEEELRRKLMEMVTGTKPGGIHCIIIGSNIQEISIRMNETLDPMFEINMSTKAMRELLDQTYHGWETMKRLVKPLVFEITRGDEPVRLSSDCVTLVVRKPVQ
ncbi:class I SAM-dependent methyltransferase [Paenibacillus pinisoli]|uniref:class I SAM-dependent methyltransferase n=1 Tax=Paenibacillus pinisoli TaxID=1276110 RepID=UPI001FB3F0AB|nr:class I SAM-dependent methyltransferase [Paenibacillus pinisoli]